MKKWTLLGLMLCLLTGTTQAQRITSGQAPVAGSTLWFNPVRTAGIDLGGSGARREFIFTNVISEGINNYYWLQANGSEFGAEFPNATLYTNQTTTYRPLYAPVTGSSYLPASVFGFGYVQQRADGLYLLGYGVPAVNVVLAPGDTLFYPRQAAAYDRPEPYLPFDFSFGNSRNETVSRHVVRGIRRHRMGVDSVQVVRTVRKSISADAFGPFISPSASYERSLRVKTTITEVDSVYLWDARLPRRGTSNVRAFELNRMQPVLYNYYADGQRGPVFSAIAAEGKVVHAAYRVEDNTPLMVFGDFGVRLNENHGVVRIPVRLTQPASQIVTARWSNVNVPGRATADEDFLTIEDRELVFMPGEQLQHIEVPVLDDTLVEDFEQFYVNLHDLDGPARIGNIDQYAVEIQDNDMPYVYLSTTDTFAREENRVVFIPVNISEAWPEGIDIMMETIDITAKAGTHYRPYADIYVRAQPYQRQLLLPIDIINDDKLQDTLRFMFRIKAVSGNARTGITDTISIGIIDDDARPNVSFVQSDTLVPEATNLPGNNVHVTLRLSYSQVEPVVVHYDIFDSTAVSGVDFEMPEEHSLVFNPGETVHVLKIPVINNLIPDQGTRVFRVRLRDFSPNAQAGPLRNHFVHISENDLTDDPSNSRSGLAAEFSLSAWPNPVTDAINLSFRPDLKPESATLFGLDGREAANWTWDANDSRKGSLRLQTTNTPAGMYLLRLQTPHGPASFRVLIER